MLVLLPVVGEPGAPAGVVPEGEEVADAVGEGALLEGLDVVQVPGVVGEVLVQQHVDAALQSNHNLALFLFLKHFKY